MSFDVSDPHSLTVLLAGAFGGALLSLLLYAVTSPLRSQCEKSGKESWLTEVLNGDGPFAWGLCWLKVGLAVALVVSAYTVPSTYYSIAQLELEAEAMRQGYEPHPAETVTRTVTSVENGRTKLWRKAGSPQP